MANKKSEKRIITTEELSLSIENLSRSMVEGFNRLFEVIDESLSTLRTELKADIFDLRKEMNQRFLAFDARFVSIENRLTHIEHNMRYRHEFLPTAKRVEVLESKVS